MNIKMSLQHTVHELGPVKFFSELGPRQSLDRRQIAYQNINTVQELWPVSLF